MSAIQLVTDAAGWPALVASDSPKKLPGDSARAERSKFGKAMTLQEVAQKLNLSAEETAELLQLAEVPKLVAYARRDVEELAEDIRAGRVVLKRKAGTR